MADVVLAGILGAVVLAVALLHKVSQKNRKVITQMRAEMAAQQIVALTGTAPIRILPDETEEEPPEPARRKGHLALYIGGLAAVLAFAGSRAVTLWRMHRTATVTVTAASMAVAGSFVITTDEITPPVFVPPATAQSTTPGTVEGQDASDRIPTVYSTTGSARDTTTFSTPGRQAPSGPPTPGASGTRTPGGDSQAHPANGTHTSGNAASPGPSTPPTQTPSTPAQDTPADEPPTPHIPAENPPAPQTQDACDGLVYVELPPLLDACLL